MAGVSKETEVAAAAVRGKAADKQIVMGNQSDIHPEASSKCACSSSSSRSLESQGGRSAPRRRYPCQRRPRDCPLVYQPPARPLRLPIHPPPSLPPRVFNPELMRLLFEKKLQNSDVSSTGRIVIPKREAEVHFPVLEGRDGLWMHLDDMDFMHVWTFKFRYWPNNTSRMYLFDNTRSLIEIHNLGVGDSLFLFKDDWRGSYVLRAKRDAMREITYPITQTTLILKPRPPFDHSQVVSGVMDANPSNLLDVIRAAEMSAVPAVVDRLQTTEMEEDNVNVNMDMADAMSFPTFDHQRAEADENIDVDGIAFPSLDEDIDRFFIWPPLCSSDSGTDYTYDHPVDEFFGIGVEQMEPFYGHPGRSPSIEFESINFSIFD
ncbi:unnamed protein product [Prunus armeniaca]|uniref:TF-B3 domain-containing protein n=1 Tax=Prunus armeniaca TaxID=36596 RepID=A0A6J5TKB4_PRUAR|nr:unnamed protein product [Prunus armeniaca]CAB4294686.1 unnamed protein product [Prunus armeniaca]